MPVVGTALSVLVVASVAASGTPAGGLSGPAPSRAAVARPAKGPAPAWLKTVRERAVLYTRNGREVTNGPDPRLAIAPDRRIRDVAGWARRQAAEKAASDAAATSTASLRSAPVRPPAGRGRLQYDEAEAAGTRGGNDALGSAERLRGFGTGRKAKKAVDVTGVQSPADRPAIEQLPPNTEDDGSFDSARDTGVAKTRGGFGTTGFIGDNPPNPDEPGATDADLYAMDLTAGQLVDVSLRRTSGDLEPLILLVDENGSFIADSFFSEDTLNPTLSAPVRADGRYYLVVVGFTIIDLGTNKVTVSKGDYAVGITARAGDVDTYAVKLAAGDVLGVNVAGAGKVVTILDPRGTELMGSQQDASFIYPTNTPLPGGGNAVADAVARRGGTHYVSVAGGDGPYSLQVEAYRPGGTGERAQTIFLDYDGQRLNTNKLFGPGVRTVSPLSAFLGRWGLDTSKRKAVGRAIKATVEENVRRDLEASGLSRTVSVKVVTSDEIRDPYGRPGVTRVVVGGTIEECGIFTIGIASSIDPGNFDRDDEAIVLLDLLSEPATFGSADSPEYSVNTYLTPASDRVRFVGQAVGNVVSHEIGHTLGSFHTDNTDTTPSLMDAGGFGFATLFGVGPDGTGGTGDDRDVDFVRDGYDLFEGFTGVEDTQALTTWALSR